MDVVRIVQISDSHLSASLGVPTHWPALLDWLRADPPALVVHSGDIVLDDPDDAADRSFAKSLLAAIPCDVAFIPGNQDVGNYGEDDHLTRRIDVFRATWGDDRFVRDLAGWRLVGIDAYLLGEDAHDEWFRAALDTPRPVMVFVHQPVHGDRDDEWRMSDEARAAFDSAVARTGVRVVASGHRHRAHRIGSAVWAPSLTISGEHHDDVGDPRLGVLEHSIDTCGGHDVRVVRPWEAISS
jgi:3',5'-cyclic AMP phosphodiesterase CpdA